MRFDYLVDLDAQEGLKTHQLNGMPIIHASIKMRRIKRFQVFLKAAVTHHPQEIGLLFQTNNDGKTACERAFDTYGKDKTLEAIGECIPFDDPKLPILHHVEKHVPQFMNDFVNMYPSAAYLRDSQGRTMYQARVASGTKTYKHNALYFVEMTDDQVREIDPGTGLYPFMVLASGQTSDLYAVYFTLRRDPSLANGGGKSVSKVGRKRKRRDVE